MGKLVPVMGCLETSVVYFVNKWSEEEVDWHICNSAANAGCLCCRSDPFYACSQVLCSP